MAKTYTIPEEFAADFRELRELEDQAYDLQMLLKQKGDVFWHNVERKLGLRGKKLKCNPETGEITVIEAEAMPAGIPLPGKPMRDVKIDTEERGTAAPSMKDGEKKGIVERAKDAVGL